MSFDFEFVKSPGCAVVTWTGVVTVADFADYYEVLAIHPKPYGGLPKLYDFRNATIDLSDEELLVLAQHISKLDDLHGRHERKVAMLVESDAAFETLRKYEVVCERLQINAEFHVTKDIDEAKAWAAISPDYVLPADR